MTTNDAAAVADERERLAEVVWRAMRVTPAGPQWYGRTAHAVADAALAAVLPLLTAERERLAREVWTAIHDEHHSGGECPYYPPPGSDKSMCPGERRADAVVAALSSTDPGSNNG